VAKKARPRAKVTRLTVAARAGLSPSTVSRALADHPGIPESTRRRVKAVAKSLGYVPSDLGRSFYQKKSFRIGVVIPFKRDPASGRLRTILSEYFSKTLFGIIHAVDPARYTVNVIADGGLDAGALAAMALSHSVDGFVFLGLRAGDGRPRALHEKSIPFVLIHHYEAGHPFPFVDIDSESGYRALFTHLASKGVKDFAWIAGDPGYLDATDRDRIVERLAPEFGLTLARKLSGRYSRRGGREAGEALLKGGRLPHAIVCANDRSAYGVIEALRAAGRRVPEDVRVTAFDNNDLATLVTPALTTLDNPFFEIGRLAGLKMLALFRGEMPSGERVKPTLIVRDSA